MAELRVVGQRYGPGTGLFSHPVARAVSSALGRFTSVFGMGTGGSTPLSPPRPPSRSQVPSSKLRFSAGLELETWNLELGTKSLALSLILKAGGRARGRAASHSAIGAARLHPLPDFDVRSINQLVLLGPYDLEGRGSSSWSVLRA
jgi:hypothetical protein